MRGCAHFFGCDGDSWFWQFRACHVSVEHWIYQNKMSPTMCSCVVLNPNAPVHVHSRHVTWRPRWNSDVCRVSENLLSPQQLGECSVLAPHCECSVLEQKMFFGYLTHFTFRSDIEDINKKWARKCILVPRRAPRAQIYVPWALQIPDLASFN